MSFLDFFKFKSNAQLYRERLEREEREAQSPKRQRQSLEELFGKPILLLEKLFSDSPATLETEPIPRFPKSAYLGKSGIKAFVQMQNIELSLFPRYLDMIRSGYQEDQPLHFEKDQYHSFLTFNDELGGRNVWLLTNDTEIIRKLAAEQFNPTPPWMVWYQSGPHVRYTQGREEYWYDNYWEPFWSNLSVEDQNAFLRYRRAETVSYISDEDWEDWVFHIRMLDKRTREILERGETP